MSGAVSASYIRNQVPGVHYPMPAKYVLNRSDGQFMFYLEAGNGEVILTGERYSSKDTARHGIAACRTNSPIDSQYERKISTAGQHSFVLKAANQDILGTSAMYPSENARDIGIDSCRHNGLTNEIEDHT